MGVREEECRLCTAPIYGDKSKESWGSTKWTGGNPVVISVEKWENIMTFFICDACQRFDPDWYSKLQWLACHDKINELGNKTAAIEVWMSLLEKVKKEYVKP